ncbi:hypothetical protein M885DRAFT_416829, partial [Pelagophyceae sp. CCMP2097]
YVFGVLVLTQGPEDMKTREAIYYWTVSYTTVGFGDVVPTTNAGRVFAMFYILVGMMIVFPVILEVGDFTITNGERRFLALFDDNLTDAVDPLWPQVVFSIGLFVIPLLVGTIFFGQNCARDQWTWFDAIWWSFATITTIGYGDINYGCTAKVQGFLVFFILVSVVAVATAIENLIRCFAKHEKQLREQKLLERFDVALIQELDANGDGAGRAPRGNYTLGPFYLVGMLTQLGYVDSAVIERFTAQFNALDADGSGKLTKEDLDLLAAQLRS